MDICNFLVRLYPLPILFFYIPMPIREEFVNNSLTPLLFQTSVADHMVPSPLVSFIMGWLYE